MVQWMKKTSSANAVMVQLNSVYNDEVLATMIIEANQVGKTKGLQRDCKRSSCIFGKARKSLPTTPSCGSSSITRKPKI
ncbi:hypothetical protein PsorP6_016742 [Peronosclerospora sorghi]|uniref:Uncharacterized protein n=1 Tax=Peronosclerospora sorghi TaxID=230839 RepID=A0ACC0WF27_9STRA|nr:hypothetical protein PsorP6_016742 [Peronosclerospora sorghi]